MNKPVAWMMIAKGCETGPVETVEETALLKARDLGYAEVRPLYQAPSSEISSAEASISGASIRSTATPEAPASQAEEVDVGPERSPYSVRIQQDLIECIESLRGILPLAEAYLKGAPTHPDNAKLEDARALLHEYGGRK